MSIRIKLVITYIIMIILSINILIIAGTHIMEKSPHDMKGMITNDMPIEEIVYESSDVLAHLKNTEITNPALLLDEDFMLDINNRLSNFSGKLIVKHNDEFNNVGQLDASPGFYNELLKYNSSNNHYGNNSFKYQDSFYYFIAYDFTYKDQTITYYFILDLFELRGIHGNYVFTFLFALITIFLVVILPLTYILSKDIIQPLRKLEDATNNIKEGNLDFKLEATSKNEIGRVTESFERMRFELKKSLEQQLQYEENRKELISSISHDLKTPITSIKGYVEGIMDGVANSPERLDKYLNVIYDKSEHMDRLIDDLFLFSKLDLKRLPFHMEDVNLSSFMDNCVNELKLEYSKQDIIINLENKADVDTLVTMDSQKIKRVIFNVVQNAIKYMDKDKKILILTVEEVNQIVTIRITDNGIGITEENLKFIFDKFYRIDESRNTRAGGTGLGLSIAKQIIEAHQGHIGAESTLNVGTTVFFSLNKS